MIIQMKGSMKKHSNVPMEFGLFSLLSIYFKLKSNGNELVGLGNRGRLKVLNDTNLVLNEHE